MNQEQKTAIEAVLYDCYHKAQSINKFDKKSMQEVLDDEYNKLLFILKESNTRIAKPNIVGVDEIVEALAEAFPVTFSSTCNPSSVKLLRTALKNLIEK